MVSLSSCSDDDPEPAPAPTPGPETPDTPRTSAIALSLTDGGFAGTSGESFKPGFTTGAKAGLFAVKGGEIKASNIELAFDGNTWNADAEVPADCDHYFVYSPYKTDAASKVTATSTDAAQFFAGVITAYATPGSNQANFDEAVRPFDVTYADATATAADGSLNLTATATHALAVATWSLPGGTNYTTADGFVYGTTGGAVAKSVKLGNENITPGTVNGKQAFFHLPAQAGTINITYTHGGTEKTAIVALGANAGTISETLIEGGSTDGGRRDLKVGDLYYRDGTILPVEALDALDKAPEGVAGIVFCADPARFSAEETKLLGKVHALVVSAKMGRHKSKDYMVWSDAYPETAELEGRYVDNIEDPKYPGLVLPNIEDINDPVKSYKVNIADIDGYKYNQIIRQRRSSEIAKGHYPVFSAIDNLNSTVGVSGNTTGWYLPSIGHVLDILHNIGGTDISESIVLDLPTDPTEKGSFMFGETANAPLIDNLDKAMAKIADNEKDSYASARNALWSSSYGSRYYTWYENRGPAPRQAVFEYNLLFVHSYDVIGKGNVRGILAF